VAGSQYAEIHNCAFYDGHEEPAQPGDTTTPPDHSVLGSGVVDGKKEGNRVKGEEEIYVSEFDHHGIWLDETRWTRRAVSPCHPIERPQLAIENLVGNLWEHQSCGKHTANQEGTEAEGWGYKP